MARSESAPPTRGEREGERAGGNGKAERGARGGGPVLDAVVQTLGELGLGNVGSLAPPPVRASEGTRTDNDQETSASSAGQNVGLALREFMQELFQALGPGGDSGPVSRQTGSQGEGQEVGQEASEVPSQAAGQVAGGPPPPPPPPPGPRSTEQTPPGQGGPVRGYGDLGTRLESLAQSLSSDTRSATGLNEAFESLKTALQGGQTSSESESETNAVDLRSFIKALAQNLASTGKPGAGNVINTSA